jgi:predicted PurR-regulated permease PerM
MAHDWGVEKAPRVTIVEHGGLESLLEGAAAFTGQAALSVVAAYFLLIDGDRLFGRLFRMTPAGTARPTLFVDEVGLRMSRYVRTVTLINIGLGTLLTGALFLLGLPNPWLWGGLAVVLNYVPYLGPALGLGLVALASIVTFPTTGQALAPPLVYLALSVIEGNLVTPLVLGRAFRVSPLVVFVWVCLWVWLWSVPGAILATPLLMLLKLVSDERPSWSALGYLIQK